VAFCSVSTGFLTTEAVYLLAYCFPSLKGKTMNDSNSPKRRWYRFSQRALLLGLLVFSGCGPSKEQRAVDAYNRGIAYAEKADYDRAIADYTEAIRLDPKLAEAYCSRGAAYGRGKSEYDKAIDDLTEAIRLNPKYADASGGALFMTATTV